jgi:NAD+ kinase
MSAERRPGYVRVMTHGRPDETGDALLALAALAVRHGVTLALDDEEIGKHCRDGLAAGVVCATPDPSETRLCVTLGGDGTILRALRAFARTPVPVFAVNFGQVGFLATVDADQLEDGFERALAGTLDMLRLPALELELPGARHLALNDIAVHRRVGGRVAELSYTVSGEEVGSVRCDGLVVATPAGSTGYNLANGGPVLAWGVAGMVVSFIAPHSLSARALVIAPDDVLTVHNRANEGLALTVDGRPVGELAPDGGLTARFVDGVATLAQMGGSSFYHRLREKFGALSR